MLQTLLKIPPRPQHAFEGTKESLFQNNATVNNSIHSRNAFKQTLPNTARRQARAAGARPALPGHAALTASLPSHGGSSFQAAAGRGLCSSLPAPPPPLPSLRSLPLPLPSLPPPGRPERPERPAGRGNERAPRPSSPCERVPGVSAAPAAPRAAGERRGRRHGRAGAGGALRVGLVSGAELGRAAASSWGDSGRRGGAGSGPCPSRAVRGMSRSSSAGSPSAAGGGCAAPLRLGLALARPGEQLPACPAGPARRTGAPTPSPPPRSLGIGGGLPSCPGPASPGGLAPARTAGAVNCTVRPFSEAGKMKKWS